MVDERERPRKSEAMERSSLARILADVPGIENDKDTYQVSPEQRLDAHLGDSGRPFTLTDLASITLEDHFLLLISREDESRHYLEYEAIMGISVKPVMRAGRRAGFS
jgi:hypothetical protein